MAAILHLTNIRFVEGDDMTGGVMVADDHELRYGTSMKGVIRGEWLTNTVVT